MAGLTSIEHTAIGALCGALEVCIMQPTVGIKNALQEGRAIPRAPAALYRGLTVNAVSMAPITATQFGVNRALEQFVKNITGVFSGRSPDESIGPLVCPGGGVCACHPSL